MLPTDAAGPNGRGTRRMWRAIGGCNPILLALMTVVLTLVMADRLEAARAFRHKRERINPS